MAGSRGSGSTACRNSTRPIPRARSTSPRALNGGRILGFSDAHYGDYMRLLAPGRGINMGDGWETRRRREPGYDWMIIALGARGEIEKA
jgi:allantoicase